MGSKCEKSVTFERNVNFGLRDGNVFVWLGFLSCFSEKIFIGR